MSDQPSIWPEVIGRLVRREDLPPELVEEAMAAILGGQATDAQIAAFAVTLRAKGETVDELAALVRTMLQFSTPLELPAGSPVVDTCGTGGAKSRTMNISTIGALVVAGAGVRVAKHGNRAASSTCGSADLLERLGVVIDLGSTGVARCIEEAGIGFCFAPKFHPAMRFAGPARRELGTRTTFNFLGPLANPARVRHQVLGVSDPAMGERMAGVLAQLGTERALVFCGDDGLDELTTTGPSTVYELRDGEITSSTLDPIDFGIARAEHSALIGGDAGVNADSTRRVLDGEKGAARDVIVLNAAAALTVAGAVDDIHAGIDAAAAAIDDGRAAATLDAFVTASAGARDTETA
jgi:anthranilate phosphoribosyltransferase